MRPPTGARGFVDLFTSMIAVYGMIVATPLGGISARAWHWATGQKRAHRPLLSYFETETGPERRPGIEREPPPGRAFEPIALANVPPASVIAPSGLPPNLARSVALMLANGRVVDGGNFDVQLTPPIRRALERAHVRVPDEKASAIDRERAVFECLSKLIERLGSEEAAVAALTIDVEDLRFALAMARATDLERAGRYEVFRTFLPPGNRAEADELVDGTFALATAYAMRWPLARRGAITSGFGDRDDPLVSLRETHRGIDISVPSGTEILAVADGRVLYAASDAANGRFVKLDHGHGLTSVYCHASRLEVHQDAIVKKGDVIARSGATGRATGPHLHLQIEINRRAVDPTLFLSAN
jgi:murein DD-endopeptidase